VILSNTDHGIIDLASESGGSVELRQLQYFVAVAEELHFRRAAARLHVSQPPLSHQIQQLESELGCRLLSRTRRRVELTPAGEVFLHDARRLLTELDGAVAAARRIGAGQTGRLRINFVGSALLSILPLAVQRFRAARPAVEIELRERPSAEQLRAVAGGAVDAGLVRPPIELTDELCARVVLRERSVAALPAEHPLARLRRVPLPRLAAEPLVLFPRSQAPGFHDLLVASLTTSGRMPQVVQYAPEMTTIIGLVAAGIGVSLVPESVARLGLEGVVYRPVAGAPGSELVAVTRAGEPAPLVEAFIEEAVAAGRAAS
jgi:DNA-binding transcriptional LysR family regulator